jgi:hypothetical protein
MDRYRVTVKQRPSPPDYEALEFAYVLRADSSEEAEAIIRRRLSRGPYRHARWMIAVEKLT